MNSFVIFTPRVPLILLFFLVTSSICITSGSSVQQEVTDDSNTSIGATNKQRNNNSNSNNNTTISSGNSNSNSNNNSSSSKATVKSQEEQNKSLEPSQEPKSAQQQPGEQGKQEENKQNKHSTQVDATQNRLVLPAQSNVPGELQVKGEKNFHSSPPHPHSHPPHPHPHRHSHSPSHHLPQINPVTLQTPLLFAYNNKQVSHSPTLSTQRAPTSVIADENELLLRMQQQQFYQQTNSPYGGGGGGGGGGEQGINLFHQPQQQGQSYGYNGHQDQSHGRMYGNNGRTYVSPLDQIKNILAAGLFGGARKNHHRHHFDRQGHYGSSSNNGYGNNNGNYNYNNGQGAYDTLGGLGSNDVGYGPRSSTALERSIGGYSGHYGQPIGYGGSGYGVGGPRGYWDLNGDERQSKRENPLPWIINPGIRRATSSLAHLEASYNRNPRRKALLKPLLDLVLNPSKK